MVIMASGFSEAERKLERPINYQFVWLQENQTEKDRDKDKDNNNNGKFKIATIMIINLIIIIGSPGSYMTVNNININSFLLITPDYVYLMDTREPRAMMNLMTQIQQGVNAVYKA